MDIAILILRLALGALIAAHGLQKSFGWFKGPGFAATSGAFHAWGFRPGGRMVILASLFEVIGGVLLILGLATPVACAILVGTLTVATSPNVAKGFWAAHGGVELPVTYAVIAVALAFSGGGLFSIDALIGFPQSLWVSVVAVVVGAFGAALVLVTRRAHLASDRTATEPA